MRYILFGDLLYQYGGYEDEDGCYILCPHCGIRIYQSDWDNCDVFGADCLNCGEELIADE